MKKTFREIEKEQFNARIPPDLVTRIIAKADRKGWGIGRTVTETLAIGLGVDPSEYGIETSKESVA